MEVARSRVIIKDGKINIESEPKVRYCPIHEKVRKRGVITKESVEDSIEWRMELWGLFTPERKIKVSPEETAVSFGASEILATSLTNGLIDCAVIVCEGVGTVITTKSDVCQGIGAVLSCIIKTSPIDSIINRLKDEGVLILDEINTPIDQAKGVKLAIDEGFSKIGVTIRGPDAASVLSEIVKLEKKHGVDVYKLIVSTTGVKDEEVRAIEQAGDIVWSCASKLVRGLIGPKALAQVGVSLPAYVLTEKGKDMISNHIRQLKSKVFVLSERQADNLDLNIDPPQPFI
jgi:putative methanogenesis marker protein 8